MSKILFLVNHEVVIYNFRLELVKQLLADGHQVVISSPYGERIEELKTLGCGYHRIDLTRHGMNPVKELKLVSAYKKLLNQVKPDMVFTYTIKPNIYGSIACRSQKIPCVTNITGLGAAGENGGVLQKITVLLYKYAFTQVQRVFFQNAKNMQFFADRKIALGKHGLLPGSGVNLEQHCFEEYPEESGELVFLTIGRIMRDKGIDELLGAAREIKKEFPNVRFRLIGFYDGDYQNKVEAAVKEGAVEFLGFQRDVHSFVKTSHATIHASYHEGMSNVLLESAAAGRPVIATDVPGCREAYDDGVSGISCRARSTEDLTRAIRQFILLSHEEKAAMGRAGREKMEREFDRRIVIQSYLEEIEKALGAK